MRTLWIAVVCFLVVLEPAAAAGPPQGALAQQSDLDHVWTITAAALVFFMQAGFLLLEAGSVRSKNSVNVAQKNLMDFILSTVVFGAFGYMLMFGDSFAGWWGWQPDLLFFGHADNWGLTFFIFQLMFCGTAATIMSGAVAERMSINGYLIATLLIALLIYPVAGHWVWGGALTGDETPILASIGFMDFAGSTVVHSVGAWVALAAIIIIGPRIGKFDENGRPRNLHGHSPVLATLGAIILWVGWIGFNGGSLLNGTGAFASIIATTIVSGGAGGLTLLLIGRVASGHFRPDATINGVLGGLVAITAGADVMSVQTAFFIGAGGGAVVFLSHLLLESVLKLDDPLGAIPVHGFAGAFGTLAVAFFAPEDSLLAASRMEQIWVQLQGIGLVFVWSFGVAFALLKVADVLLGTSPEGGKGLRVPEIFEREGLNQHEHDAPMGTGILQQVMAEVARSNSGLPEPLDLDYGDEAYETSVLFNRIIQKLAAERDDEEVRYQANKAKRLAVEAEIAEVVQACAQGDFSKRLATEGRRDFILELCKGINGLCTIAEDAMNAINSSLTAISAGDLSCKMEGNYGGQVADIQSAMNTTLDHLSNLVDSVNTSVSAAGRGDFSQAIELEGKSGFLLNLCSEVNALCQISEKGLSEMLCVLSQIGDGDLTARMSDEYEGRFSQISQTMDKMTTGIAELLASIQETSVKVTSGSTKISNLSASVVSRSESQSENLTEMIGVLKELTEIARQNASEAQAADENCRNALESAESGVVVSKELDQQIGEVQRATGNIMEALSKIEVIAKQTNLLSLNASVEAVRGGGEGSAEGFKVVAQEIRSLADSSAEAASDIRGRVVVVQEAVQRGVELVSETDALLGNINLAVSQSSDFVNRLTENGTKQVQISARITAQVSEISKESQDNLAMANESADTSKQLDQDAAQNLKRIARFQWADEKDDLAA